MEADLFENTAEQKAQPERNGTRFVRNKIRPFAVLPPPAKEIQGALKSTPVYPSDDRRIVALAKKITAKSKLDEEKVASLIHYVYQMMEFQHKESSVLKTLETLVGDCTETSDLFTTLARAVGIPSNSVSGIVYTDDILQSFGGHQWNEVLLDGKWVAVDPTWDQVRADVSHIRMSDASLGPSAFLFRQDLGQVKVLSMQ